MDIERRDDEKITEAAVKQKLSVGVKVVLTVIVLGAVATGIYAAMAMAK